MAASLPQRALALGSDTPAFFPDLYSGKGLKLHFRPYELKLRHSFNLAKSSRTVTPGVQVQIDFDGVRGYGEASMPPYLG